MTHLIFSLKNFQKNFENTKEFLETDGNHDEIYGDNWRDKKDVWMDYVENDVLCTAFSKARCCKMIQEITRFGETSVCLYQDWDGNVLIR